MIWLRFGPLAVCMESDYRELPWPWPAFLARHPGRARWLLRLRVEGRRGAGEDGPLRWGQGAYLGPGFQLTPQQGHYRAEVSSPVACMGALAAALVHESIRGEIALAHGALLAVGRCGVLVLGASGAGKSTVARRAGRRAWGSNAALLWREGHKVAAVALPLTGHGDAAVIPRELGLVGARWLGHEPRGGSPAGQVAWWLGGLAAAVGQVAPLDQALWLAKRVPLRGQKVSQGIDRLAGVARPPQAE